jgi:phage baseplate assembly protein W
MAVILGKKLVKDTQEYNDYAIGITLPLQIGNTAFNQSFTYVEQASTNIKSLLLTKKFERVMQPQLGSGLHELLFQFNDDNLAADIEDIIINQLATWLPYVTINDITIEQTNLMKDTNTVNISITFRLDNTSNLQTVTFNVQGGV